MKRRHLEAGVWALAAVLVVLLARSIAYAVSPSSAARLLEQRAGGPALPVLTLVALAGSTSLAVAICWLAALGVRERALLEPRLLAAAPPRFRAGRLLLLAVCLSVVTSVAGGLLEAYLHWRAGLGWHGLHCMFGPVHRDLIPIASGLSFVAAALIVSGLHVLDWMRRTFALLRDVPARPAVLLELPAPLVFDVPRAALRVGTRSPRAPPAFS